MAGTVAAAVDTSVASSAEGVAEGAADTAIDIVLAGGVVLQQYSAHVPASLSLSDLCFFFAAHHVSRTFVVEEQRLVGVVDLVDLDKIALSR